ncbi:MFS transporter [Rhodococcus rhodochrous]|uniref:MDR family MFS transporter n=1 Tax=Rhodococcus rhodochrous TaxID=1829 RepID=UPI000D0749A5|nr:MDR family MFS transporter [Rhodococcus rhodochrous]AYA24625.1 MFS transporter [Rhodococcus rhodochrous]
MTDPLRDEIERATPAPEQSAPRVTLVFAGLMLAMLAASLNQTVLNPALPTIVGELHGVDRMLWVITAYILASTITMPAYGKLGDLFGRKPLLLTALTIFVVGSTIGALAGDITWLIVGRAVQGAGGGGLMVLSQATIADVIPARQRGKYLGIMSSVFALSSVAGPLLGGWFTEGPGWRWVFWMSVPLGAVAVVAYMPTYLQMVAGVSATAAGLLMLPMMGTLFLTSTLAGRYVTRTGRYKRIPIIGSVFVTAGPVLLSTLGTDTPIWVLGCWFAVLGIGFGTSMQLLVLVVQNSFPVEEVGAATAGNNYFRQIGATLGSAVVGSVFAARLAGGLSGTGIDNPDSLTPGAVRALPDALRQPVLEAYNDALVPIYLYIAPLVVVAGVLLCLVVEKPLATTIVRKNDPAPNDPAATAST